MHANAQGVSVPHYQLAFIPVWYTYDADVYGPHRAHRNQIDDCDENFAYRPNLTITPTPITPPDAYLKERAWALHAAYNGNNAARFRGKEVIWHGGADLALVNVYTGTPKAPSATIQCEAFITKHTTETPTPQSFVEWAPKWLEARVGQTQLHDDPTSYNPWDGVRIDSPGNIFKTMPEIVDYNLDGDADIKSDINGNYIGYENADGRKYLDRVYREGVHAIFTRLYQNHAGLWLMGGNDAWHPDGSSPDDSSGFGELSNMHFTIAENWTKRWGSDGVFEFMRWPDPNTGAYYDKGMTFETVVRIWDTWTHHGNGRKGFVILSKCDDPLENKCNGLEAGNLNDNEYGWADMHREFRFSLAAALMLDAYHAFTGEGYHMAPYWYDEYAVFWDGSKAQAARTNDEKAKGIGWLGFPVSDPLGLVHIGNQVYAVPDYNPTNLCKALDNTRSGQNPNVEDFNAWIRYFEHGVAILNPSSDDMTVALDPNTTYYSVFQRRRLNG